MRLAILTCLAFIMILWAVPPTSAAQVPNVIIDGQAISFDVPPMIDNGRTLVPLRAIFEKMGAIVNWDSATQTATAVKDNTKVVVRIGSIYPTINDAVKTIDVPAKVVENRTLAPMRFVCEAFGGTVSWDETTNTITVVSAANTESNTQTSTHLKIPEPYGRNNPAPIGVSQNCTIKTLENNRYVTYSVNINVVEVLRGYSAWQRVDQASRNNPEPAADRELILAKIKTRLVSVKEEPSGSGLNHGLYSSDSDFTLYLDNYLSKGKRYEGIVPAPAYNQWANQYGWSTNWLYVGQSHIGYIVYELPKSELTPKISYSPPFYKVDPIWFKLY